MLSILTFAACLPAPTESVADTSYIWQGWIYGDLPSQDAPGLETGTVRVWDLEGEFIAEGSQNDVDRLALWTIEIDGVEEVEVRVSGPEQVTTVWRTTTPSTQTYWYAGTLFAPASTSMDTFWADLSELTQVDLATDSGVNLLGEALLVWPEDEAGWTDATITVYDGDGRVHHALTLGVDEDGLLVPSETIDGPIVSFAATGLAPGPIRLVIDSSDGRSAVVDYNAGPGELLSAFSFTLPEPT